MTPTEEAAMQAAWIAWHHKSGPEDIPAVNLSFSRGFEAGLSISWKQAEAQIDAQTTEIADLCGKLTHERESIVAQLDARAAEVAQCDCTQCSNAAAELREQAAKIRRWE